MPPFRMDLAPSLVNTSFQSSSLHSPTTMWNTKRNWTYENVHIEPDLAKWFPRAPESNALSAKLLVS